MRRRGLEKVLGVTVLALIALLALSPLARADDSQIRISEVYSDGTAAHRDFIELQLLADGQSIPGTGNPGGASIQVCNAMHTVCTAHFLFPADSSLPAALSQRTVTFGWEDNPSYTPDFTIPANTPAPNLNFPIAGGDACYYTATNPNLPRDCVAWGASTGNAPSVGTPAPAMNGALSLTRTEARGCPTLMEAVDDTDDSASDFSLTSPTPRSNFATPSEVKCQAAAPAPPPPLVTVTKKKCKKKAHHSAAAAKKKCKRKKKK
jgi:type II secretory pathway pseudopilin PulG